MVWEGGAARLLPIPICKRRGQQTAEGRARRFAEALNAENIACGTMYDNTIPDRHIYKNWPFMMSGLAEERRAPWKSPFYKGDVKGYTRDQCPRSLDYLGRAVMMFIDQNYTLEDADLAAEGICKVAAAIL